MAATPRNKSGGTKTIWMSHIPEAPIAVVAEEDVTFVGEIGNDDVGMAIIVEVAEVDTHSGKGLAVLVVTHACQEAHLAERTVAVVVVQEALHGIIGYENICKAIPVIIGKGHTEPLAIRIGDTGFRGNVGERAVPIVVE